jgi:hypothetical protein
MRFVMSANSASGSSCRVNSLDFFAGHIHFGGKKVKETELFF